MVLWGVHSDRTGERRWHICISVLVAVVVLLSAVFSMTLTIRLFFLCLVTGGSFSALSLFWSLPLAVLTPAMAAAGMAMINALGNFSGLVQPYIMGLAKDLAGWLKGGLMSIMVFAIAAAVIIWKVGRRVNIHAGTPAAQRTSEKGQPRLTGTHL